MSDVFSFAKISSEIGQKETLAVPCGTARIFQWFALVNAAVVISISLLFDWELALVLLPIGCLWPFIGLFFSKTLAIKAHAMTLIDPANFADEA